VSAVIPNRRAVLVASGGGGASIPAAPADVLLDVGNPSTLTGLDSGGIGTSYTPAAAYTLLGLDAFEPAGTPAPLLWWKCDETNVAATTLANSGSAGTANLTLTSATAAAAGPWGDPGLQIGTSGYARAPVNVAQPTASITVALWFRQSALGNARLIVRPYGASWASPYTAVDIFIGSGGLLAGGIAGGGAEQRANSAGPIARAGEWHHAALTYDGTTLRLYQDGVQVATASYSGTIDYGAAPTATAWCVGGNNLVTSEQMAGELADVRIYNVTQSASWVARVYKRGRRSYKP